MHPIACTLQLVASDLCEHSTSSTLVEKDTGKSAAHRRVSSALRTLLYLQVTSDDDAET
jgi:hypothetical protein